MAPKDNHERNSVNIGKEEIKTDICSMFSEDNDDSDDILRKNPCNKADKCVQVSPSEEVKMAIKIATLIATEASKGNIPNSYKYPAIPYCSNTPGTTMARLVSDLLVNHSVIYTSMVKQLAPDVNDGYKSFKIIAENVFDEGNVTWGRIVSLYALLATIAVYLKGKNKEVAAMQFAKFVGRYLGEKAECWIQENGGWDSLSATYPSKHEAEGKIWRGLLITGLGLGVAAAYLAAH